MGRPGILSREERLGHPGWCVNLVAAGAIRSREAVLIVVDEPLAAEGAQLAAAVVDVGGLPRLELWAGERPLVAAPEAVIAAARAADLCLFLSQAPLGEEANARFELAETVRQRGGREICMGFIDGELLRGELSEPAPDLAEAARRLLADVEGARTIRLRGSAGTDLELRVEGRPWLTDALPLAPGGYANYPGGEVYVAPHGDGADGLLVADLTVPYTVEGPLDEPVRLRFRAGKAVAIEGGRAAGMLRELVERSGEGADVIAELGIGLNTTIRPRGHVMLDEKAADTAHVAIGRSTYGGDNAAAIHVDMVFSGPELEVDGRRIELP